MSTHTPFAVFPRSFRRCALAVAAAAAFGATPAAWADAVVGGFVSLSSSGSFAGGAGDFNFATESLWVGFAGETVGNSFTGTVTFNGGTQASFRSISTAQPQSGTALPLGDFNVIRVQDSGTKLSTQGVSTGFGRGDIYVTGSGHLDARSTSCGDTNFNFFFCSTQIGNGAPSQGSLEVSGSGSVYETRALSIATAGTSTGGGQVGASVDVFAGGTLRSWNVNVASRNGSTGNETALGIMRINGAGSTWIVDGYDSVANGAAPANFTTAPFVILGRYAGGTGQMFIEDGGTLRLEKKDATSGAPFVILGFGGPSEGTITGTGSKLEFQTGTVGSLQVGFTSGGSSTLTVEKGGQVLGAQFVGIGRARFANGVQDPGGTGTLIVDGAGSLVRIDEATAAASPTSVGQLDIGRGAAANGTVTVRNGGRIEILGTVGRTNGPTLLIGREGGETGAPVGFTGSGTLNIQGAGSVVEMRADDVLGGANSAVRVGRTGTGTGNLNITGGGKLTIEGNAASSLATFRSTSFIVGGSGGFSTATLAGGNGNVLVSGIGSEILMKGNDLFASVGDGPGGNGQMTISNGGKFTGTLFQVGRVRTTGLGDTANGTLTMNGGQMLLSGQFNSTQSNAVVGASLSIGTDAGSTGIMTMSNGSTVQIQNTTLNRAASLFVGANPNFSGSTGSLVMTTGSSISIQGLAGSNLSVGATGTGSLTMNTSSITMASNGQANINGSVQLSNGSLLDAGSFLGIAASGGTGSLLINNSEVKAAEIVIGTGGFLGGSGATVIGNLTNNGTFSPGASPGRFTILGNYTAGVGSKLILEVESDGAGGFLSDEVIFGGTVDLAGLAIEFRFLGDTSLQEFANTGNFQIDHFLKKEGGGVLDDSSFTEVSFAATAGNMALEGFQFDPAVGIPAAVPEPQTWALMLLGLGALGSLARRRRAG
ncbi:MAG: PEPxxWA-CTERM sorting domain-containing protein [Burkholderiales bacterium]|nr:PEPxxWA-CTERM sorting domain-containing protein [Burkholderiales bacterium]